MSGAIGLKLASAGPSAASHTASTPAQPTFTLPAPPSGFAIPKPTELSDATGQTRWAPVIRATPARAQPSASSRVVNFVSTITPEGTANIVVATGEVSRDGLTWVRASLPALAAAAKTGWVPRSSLGGWSFVDTHVVIDRNRLTLTLFRNGHSVFQTPVGVGTSTNPTPAGTFYIRDRLTSFASPEYGPLAFGTSARAPYLTGWPDGGYIGIHGTDAPQLIPGHISHGCIRLQNSAILKLGRLMPVGTPVIVK
ncbi:MAG: L,D-transpeptidase [Solirubrobacteraceae bacterium]